MNDDELTDATELPDVFPTVPTPAPADDDLRSVYVTAEFLAKATRANNSALGKAAARVISKHVDKKVAEALANVEAQFASLIARLESRISKLESERERQ